MAFPSLRPREAWTMRLDEALLMLAARGQLMSEGKRDGGGKGYQETADGRRVYAIDSMEKLGTFLKSGRV